MNKENSLISVIVPMHNETEVIEQFFTRITPILDSVGNWEIICVDDGSTDDTWQKITYYTENNKQVRGLRLSRNFGKEAALTAGLDSSKGDAVIPIDADLQDPPELIPEMVEKWQQGFKVVLATRRSRDEGWLKRKSAGAFYKLMQKVSHVKIPENTGDFRLMDRMVVETIKKMTERTRFMKGIFAWSGYTTTTIFFDRPERAAGQTKWNYWKLWRFALDGIFSFTTLPLRIWTYIGATISIFAFIYGSIILLRTLIYGNNLPGYTSIMVMILFLGGIQLLSLGVLGEYIGRIYRESKNRPIYVIEESI
ncbi:MAG: glycosyl transferase [Alphaproteobacteria bacterium CG11_big_fil_rev_8_21_14_0_20_44_7]|nr:MAG: glycosyl transferase [Alphaproteobacteria bacterium CG11_big_fil_rev_8_21_14_0_20_44_7]